MTFSVNVTVENEKEVWHTLYDERKETSDVKCKFKIGDQVRISKVKPKFKKSLFA